MTPVRLADFQPLTNAEEKLVQACREGRVQEFAAAISQARTEENPIWASFLRFLTIDSRRGMDSIRGPDPCRGAIRGPDRIQIYHRVVPGH